MEFDELLKQIAALGGRLTWEQEFFAQALLWSKRSDCQRAQVGAVIVRENRVISSGYNGAPAGESGCDTCPRRTSGVAPGTSYHNCVAIHAEANALLYARTDLRGATLFVTRQPCADCAKLIAGSGITDVRVKEEW